MLRLPKRCNDVIGLTFASHEHSLAQRATSTVPPADILQARDNSAQLAEHHYRLIYEYTTWAGYAAEQ